MLAGPAKALVSVESVIAMCRKRFIGCNRDPLKVEGVSLNARVLLVGLIIYNVGIAEQVSKHDIHRTYLNFMEDIGMKSQSMRTNYENTEKVIQELHCAGIVSAGKSRFGGNRIPSLISIDSHTPIMKVSIAPVDVLDCCDLEILLKDCLAKHLKEMDLKK